MGKTTKDLYIHLGTSPYVTPGKFHIVCAHADYKELEAFFSSHFNTVSYTHDEIGFPDKAYVCPKGSVFFRDEKGELVRDGGKE